MMRELRHKAESILTSVRRSLEESGRLLHESWRMKRTLTRKITNGHIEEMYGAGLRAGAVGGKLLNGCGGGFMVCFVRSERQQTLGHRLKHLLRVSFSLSNEDTLVLVYERDGYEQALAIGSSAMYA